MRSPARSRCTRSLDARDTADLIAGTRPLAAALSPAQARYLREVVHVCPLPAGVRCPRARSRIACTGPATAPTTSTSSRLPGGERYAEISRQGAARAGRRLPKRDSRRASRRRAWHRAPISRARPPNKLRLLLAALRISAASPEVRRAGFRAGRRRGSARRGSACRPAGSVATSSVQLAVGDRHARAQPHVLGPRAPGCSARRTGPLPRGRGIRASCWRRCAGARAPSRASPAGTRRGSRARSRYSIWISTGPSSGSRLLRETHVRAARAPGMMSLSPPRRTRTRRTDGQQHEEQRRPRRAARRACRTTRRARPTPRCPAARLACTVRNVHRDRARAHPRRHRALRARAQAREHARPTTRRRRRRRPSPRRVMVGRRDERGRDHPQQRTPRRPSAAANACAAARESSVRPARRPQPKLPNSRPKPPAPRPSWSRAMTGSSAHSELAKTREDEVAQDDRAHRRRVPHEAHAAR